jgi:hypothetical protein
VGGDGDQEPGRDGAREACGWECVRARPPDGGAGRGGKGGVVEPLHEAAQINGAREPGPTTLHARQRVVADVLGGREAEADERADHDARAERPERSAGRDDDGEEAGRLHHLLDRRADEHGDDAVVPEGAHGDAVQLERDHGRDGRAPQERGCGREPRPRAWSHETYEKQTEHDRRQDGRQGDEQDLRLERHGRGAA